MNSKTYRASALATTLLAAVTSASALQTIGDSLEVTQQLTIRGDALFEGVTAFGKLPSQSTAGYLTDVYQGVSTVEREEIIPAHEEYQTVYVDDYGWMFQVVWVDDYGWVYRDVWNPEQYDSEGNILSFGYWTNQPFWEIVGGHNNYVEVWGVVGSHPESQPVWVPEQRNTYTDTVYGIPVVRQTGQRHDVIWSWRNYNPVPGGVRELMELSPAGLSLPHPDISDGSVRAALTSTSFEQSYTSPTIAAGPYQSYGVKVQKDKIVAWFDNGQTAPNGNDPGTFDVTVTTSKTAHYKPEEVLLQDIQPAPDGLTSQTVSTRISAASSTFGGNVTVNGALLVQPQGDLTMGVYTNGPTP